MLCGLTCLDLNFALYWKIPVAFSESVISLELGFLSK